MADPENNILQVRELRKRLGITPVVKQIDTLAAEYPASTNYPTSHTTAPETTSTISTTTGRS